MFSRSALRHLGGVLRAALVLTLAAQLACVPKIAERCRLVTAPTPPPALPAGFAELDALLLRRATDMTLAARELNSSLVVVFHRGFAEQVLPDLCGRLEQARELAMAGRTAEAGRKYQALLVASQVLAFAVAMQSAAQYADAKSSREGRSPGYYREYVRPTPGVSGPGPQRIVVGRGGEMYYTSDHYQTFIPLQ